MGVLWRRSHIAMSVSCVVVIRSSSEKTKNSKENKRDKDRNDDFYSPENDLGCLFLFIGKMIETFQALFYGS